MNNNYKIFGLITSLLRSDNPPLISKDFSDKVMSKIALSRNSKKINFNNYINIAASVFFAVITAYSLISFNQSTTNVVVTDTIQDNRDNSSLIRQVTDESACDNLQTNKEDIDDNCK
jgi:hypothetical protein